MPRRRVSTKVLNARGAEFGISFGAAQSLHSLLQRGLVIGAQVALVGESAELLLDRGRGGDELSQFRVAKVAKDAIAGIRAA
jgi:hypothetical protein